MSSNIKSPTGSSWQQFQSLKRQHIRLIQSTWRGITKLSVDVCQSLCLYRIEAEQEGQEGGAEQIAGISSRLFLVPHIKEPDQN